MPAAGHVPAAADLDVIAAREVELAGVLLLVEPPGRVDVIAAGAVLVVRRQVLEQRDLAAQRAPTVSMMYLPTLPLELARPCGNCATSS